MDYAMHALGFALMLCLCGIAAASLTDLYSFSLGDPHKPGEPKGGRILSHLGIFLNARFMEFEQTTGELQAAKLRAATDEKSVLLARSFTRVNPYKMVGVCQRCTNLWVTLGVFVGIHAVSGYSWWWFPIILGISNAALSKIAGWR